MNEKYRELNPEELEQVNGGKSTNSSGIKLLANVNQGGCNSVIATIEGFNALEGFTAGEMGLMNSTDSLVVGNMKDVVFKDTGTV